VTATVSSIKPSSQRADDRAALLAAHAKRQEVVDAKQGHAAAVRRAREAVLKANDRLKKAREGVEESKGIAAKEAARALSEGRNPDGNGIRRQSRMLEVEALDECEAMIAAAQEIEAQGGEHRAAIIAADVKVAIAVRQMLVPRIQAAIARIKEMDAEAVALWGLLHFAVEGDGFRLHLNDRSTMEESELQGSLDAVFAELRAEVERMLMLRNDHTSAHKIASSWKEAAANLRKNPEALLPQP
jgi:hypothetical protein